MINEYFFNYFWTWFEWSIYSSNCFSR